jgi:hypothetical protein
MTVIGDIIKRGYGNVYRLVTRGYIPLNPSSGVYLINEQMDSLYLVSDRLE